MVGPPGFTVQEAAGERWELALELLEGGGLVVLGEIRMAITDFEKFSVFTTASTIHHVSEEQVAKDLGWLRSRFEELRSRDDRLAQVIGDRRVLFELVEDPGMGPVLVASLEDEQVVWSPSYEPPG